MKRLPTTILIVTSIIGLFALREAYHLPLHDEAFYSQGRFKDFPDWGPLYHFIYFILNSITQSRIHSFYFLLGITSLVMIPFFSYILSVRFLGSKTLAIIISSLSLLASWNLKSNPKIQIFNFCLLALAFFLRTYSSKNLNFHKVFSYLILTVSIFCRFDNIIVLFFVLSYDSYIFIKNKKPVLIGATFLISITTFLALFSVFGNPLNQSRNWRAFTDHFFWKNPGLFVKKIQPGEDYANLVQKFFNGASSIYEAFLNQPIVMLKHITVNTIHIPYYIWTNFQIYPWLSLSPFIYVVAIILLLLKQTKDGCSEINSVVEVDNNEINLFSFSLFAKCLATAVILQPVGKYIFEINIIILISIARIRLPLLKKMGDKVPEMANLLFPILAFFFYFQHPAIFRENVSVEKAVEILSAIERRKPLGNFLGNEGFLIWSQSNASHINLWPDRRFDKEMAHDLKGFLEKERIDVVLIDGSQRYLFKIIGLSRVFYAFEKKPEEFGYAAIYRSSSDPLSIYQRLNESP